jgi:5-methyltetrahydrofolate--homocysteine methyltransferase
MDVENLMVNTLEELVASVVKGMQEESEAIVGRALDEQISPDRILNEGLIAAMREVGVLFENGEYYLPEMLVSARAMQAGLNILRPKLVEVGVEAVGRVVIGTVKGDLHDIGKNLVGMMLEGAGYEIIDLGTDVAPERFAQAVGEYRPQILGMSALLTTTMQNMRSTIEALEDLSVRNQVKVIIGGAPVTEEFGRQIRADGYAPDASRAAQLVGDLTGMTSHR